MPKTKSIPKPVISSVEPCEVESTLHRIIETPDCYADLSKNGLQVEQTADRGRRVISLRDIQCGELVFRVHPFIYAVHEPWLKQVCRVCLASTRRSRHPETCQKCRQVYYCSVECKQADFINHTDIACGALKLVPEAHATNTDFTVHPILASYLRMVIDLIARRIAAKVTPSHSTQERESLEKHEYMEFTEPRLSLLQSCRDVLDLECVVDFYTIANTALQMIPKKNHKDVRVADIMDFLCRERCNAFGCVDDSGDMVAWGVYIDASFFNHSCNPNIVKTHNGPILEIYASRDIMSGEEVSLSYVTLDDNLEQRRQTTRETFFFICDCERCQHEEFYGEEAARKEYHSLMDNICGCGSVYARGVCLKCKKTKPVLDQSE